MTRKSPREIEAALDALDVSAGSRPGDDDHDIPDEQAEAIRAAHRWRRRAFPNGDGPQDVTEVLRAAIDAGALSDAQVDALTVDGGPDA